MQTETQQFPPLELVNKPNVDTAHAAYLLTRRPQTLRAWACHEDGPLRPVRINGRLAWPVAELRRVLAADMSAVPKDESPSGQGGGFQKTLQSTNATIVAPAEKLSNTQKQLATLRARCALAGVTLHTLENDHGKTVYIVSRWALTRELADLESVAAWLKKVTGVSA